MSRLTAIIIDDELPARELVKVFLKDYADINVIGEAENGFEGAKLVNQTKPDLIFLDVQMPKIDGFEMLELLDHKSKIYWSVYPESCIYGFLYGRTRSYCVTRL